MCTCWWLFKATGASHWILECGEEQLVLRRAECPMGPRAAWAPGGLGAGDEEKPWRREVGKRVRKSIREGTRRDGCRVQPTTGRSCSQRGRESGRRRPGPGWTRSAAGGYFSIRLSRAIEGVLSLSPRFGCVMSWNLSVVLEKADVYDTGLLKL